MIQTTGLTRHWNGGKVAALHDVNVTIDQGEFVCIAGESGAGKSTLLLTLGGMLRPTSGSVRLDGVDLYGAGRAALVKHRAESVGFVFQSFHLIPYLSVLDNARLATRACSRSDALELLSSLRMDHRSSHRPAALSVGERQRVAVARALIKKPRIILADEPTGNLDAESSTLVMDQLVEFQGSGGTVICATHDPALLARGTHVLQLSGGRVVD
jgi:ABC-type lipoprotein export system ATPase subunit